MKKFLKDTPRPDLWVAAAILVAVLLFISVYAWAYHMHQWMKQNESKATDAFGNVVTVCNWTCRDYATGQTHYAQTQGLAFCPLPPM